MRKWIIFFSAIALAVTAQSILVEASDTEWDRTVLPRPPQPFEGVTKRTLEGISADLKNPGRSGLGLRPGIAGVIVAESSFLGGFSLYVENGHLKHTYSLLGLKLDTISSRDSLPTGKVNVRYEFTADKPGEFGTGGTSRLFINGKQQAEAKMEHSVPFRFASYAGMDIGTDNGLPVVPKFEYAKVLPKYFKGTIEKVEFDLGPAKLSAEDLQRIYLQRFASAVRN